MIPFKACFSTSSMKAGKFGVNSTARENDIWPAVEFVDPIGPPTRIKQFRTHALDERRLDAAGMLISTLGSELGQRFVQPTKRPSVAMTGLESFDDRASMRDRSMNVDHIDRLGPFPLSKCVDVTGDIPSQQIRGQIDAESEGQPPGQLSVLQRATNFQFLKLGRQLTQHAVALNRVGCQRQMRSMFLDRRIDTEGEYAVGVRIWKLSQRKLDNPQSGGIILAELGKTFCRSGTRSIASTNHRAPRETVAARRIHRVAGNRHKAWPTNKSAIHNQHPFRLRSSCRV